MSTTPQSRTVDSPIRPAVKKDLQTTLEENALKIVLGVVLLLALGFGILFWLRYRDAQRAERIGELFLANSSQQYTEIANEHPDTDAGRWAKLLKARQNFRTANASGIYTDRATAVATLTTVRDDLKTLVDDDTPDPIRKQAMYLLGQTYEALGNPEEAIATYDRVSATFPEDFYAELAQKRVPVLKDEENVEFLAWFKGQNPKPEDRLGTTDRGTDDGGTDDGGTDSDTATTLELPDELNPSVDYLDESELMPSGPTLTAPGTERENSSEINPEPDTETETEPSTEPEPQPTPESSTIEEVPVD